MMREDVISCVVVIYFALLVLFVDQCFLLVDGIQTREHIGQLHVDVIEIGSVE